MAHGASPVALPRSVGYGEYARWQASSQEGRELAPLRHDDGRENHILKRWRDYAEDARMPRALPAFEENGAATAAPRRHEPLFSTR